MRPVERFDVSCPGRAVGAMFLLLLAACDGKQQEARPAPPPPEVGLAEVTKRAVPIVLDLSGTTTAVKSAAIIPRVSGVMFERYFTEGDFVDEGTPLYLIDPRPFEHELAGLQARLKGLQGTVEFSQAETQRYDTLAAQGNVSQERAEAARAKLNSALADLEETKVEIQNAELNLSYTGINAPFRGRIQETQINVGNLVQAQRDVLTQLVQMDPIYVVFSLSRSEVFEIQKERREGRTFEVEDMVLEVILPDGRPYPKKGRVNFVSYLIDPTTDSVTARGIFDNPKNSERGDFDLVPGQYAPVRLTVGETPDALVIPQTAVVETQAGTNVFVVGDDNKVEHRKIEVGAAYHELLVVTDGLKEGEKVVAVGVQKVKAGIEVKPTALPDPSAGPETATEAKPAAEAVRASGGG